MSLTSNYIIHTTDNIDALVGILCEGFKVTYCREQFTLHNNDYYIGVPVVSFSDIPVDQLHDQRSKYGKFSIELSKEWAVRSGLNPVIYLSNNSYVCKMIEPFLVDVELDGDIGNINVDYRFTDDEENNSINVVDIMTGDRETRINSLIGLLSFIKNYEGTVERSNGEVYKNYRFYDEREWRYVPSREDFENARSSYDAVLNKKLFKLYKKTSAMTGNRFLKDIRLKFSMHDINKIYVQSRKDKVEILKRIKHETCKESLVGLDKKIQLSE